MWIKDSTWNTDLTNIYPHHLARCVVTNQWNFPSLTVTCLLIINNSSKFPKFVGVKAALWFTPGYQNHGRRPCELKMERKCYIAGAFTQTINILAHSAEKQHTDQFVLQNRQKNTISNLFSNTHQQVSLPEMAITVVGFFWVRRDNHKNITHTHIIKNTRKAEHRKGLKWLLFVPFNPERMIVGDKSS